jgi:hypothetical protein
LASLAQAQIVLHVTGSTAFRGATHTAIGNILNSGYTVGYSGTTLNSAGQAVFSGTTKVGNTAVVIKTSWSGSVGGVQTLSQLSPALTVATWLQTGLTGAGLTGPYDSAAPADVTMSDSFQSSTAFYGTGYATLVDTTVGVVPFVWVKGQTNDPTVALSAPNLTNVTSLLARALLSAGTVPLSQFTGASGDSTIDVDATGRDEDSGTRLDTFAESGFGVFGSPLQYDPTVAGGVITSIAPWPANTVDGIAYTQLGHSGFSSGGSLATALNSPVNTGATDPFGNKFLMLGYAGLSDAVNVNGGNNELMYNGVPYSAANVQQGRYTFWSYEHLMYRNTLAPASITVAQLIAQQILTQDATVSGVLVGSMQVSRRVEGGIVSHN